MILIYQTRYIFATKQFERSVAEMCNASQGVLNKDIEISTEKGIIIGKIKAYAEIGFTVEEIAEKSKGFF